MPQDAALSLDAPKQIRPVKKAGLIQNKKEDRNSPPLLTKEEIEGFVRQLGLEGSMHDRNLVGGFGRVFIARDARLGRSVAVKVLYKKWEPNRFKREGVSIQTLCGKIPTHTNLVVIHASGETKDYFFYTMECANNCAAEGKSFKPDTLTARIQKRESEGGMLPEPSEVIVLFRKLLDGLEVLHSNGLAHLDIKPDNIIFVGDEPKIGDFSLLTSISVSPELLAGTRGYVPDNPRILKDGNLDGVDWDLYAMGKLLYRYVTCKSVDDYSEFPELKDVMPLQKKLFYQKLNNFLLKACNAVEEFRFHNVDDFRWNLLACLPVEAEKRHWGGILGWAGVSLAVVLAIAFAFMKGNGKAREQFAEMPAEALGSINELSPVFGGDFHAKSSYCLGFIDKPEQQAGVPVLDREGKPTTAYCRTARSTVLRLSPDKQLMVPVPCAISDEFELAFLCCGNTRCNIGVQIVQPRRWWRPEKQLAHLNIDIDDVVFLADLRVFLQDNRIAIGVNGGKTASAKTGRIPGDASLCLAFSSEESGEVALSFFKCWEGAARR